MFYSFLYLNIYRMKLSDFIQLHGVFRTIAVFHVFTRVYLRDLTILRRQRRDDDGYTMQFIIIDKFFI